MSESLTKSDSFHHHSNKTNKYIIVRAYNIEAVFSVDENRRIKTVVCTNREICRDLQILDNNDCPRYCLILVACRDYVSGIRIPKIKGEIEELDPEVVKKYPIESFVNLTKSRKKLIDILKLSKDLYQQTKYVAVLMPFLRAVFSINGKTKETKTIICSNRDLCNCFGVLQSYDECPPYCIARLIAKDYFLGRKFLPNPWLEIRELDEDTVKNYPLDVILNIKPKHKELIDMVLKANRSARIDKDYKEKKESDKAKYVYIKAKNAEATFSFDKRSRKIKTLVCSRKNTCKELNILNSDGSCPQYCELIVAAKDHILGRRIPRIDGEIKELDSESFKKLHLEV